MFKDIAHPINSDARAQINKAVLDAYYKEIKK
jgi:DNA-binding cell septation regulator SpoVG